MCSPPRLETSKPSIRTGSDSRSSASWSDDERVDPLAAAPLLAQLVLGERQRGVALGQLAQAPLDAALGDPHLDRARRGAESASASSSARAP